MPFSACPIVHCPLSSLCSPPSPGMSSPVDGPAPVPSVGSGWLRAAASQPRPTERQPRLAGGRPASLPTLPPSPPGGRPWWDTTRPGLTPSRVPSAAVRHQPAVAVPGHRPSQRRRRRWWRRRRWRWRWRWGVVGGRDEWGGGRALTLAERAGRAAQLTSQLIAHWVTRRRVGHGTADTGHCPQTGPAGSLGAAPFCSDRRWFRLKTYVAPCQEPGHCEVCKESLQMPRRRTGIMLRPGSSRGDMRHSDSHG